MMLVVAFGLVPATSSAQEGNVLRPQQPVSSRFKRDLPRNHDRGVLARVSLGVGYALVASDAGEDRFEESGLGAMPSLAIGWLPWEQLALHGSAWGMLGGDVGVLGLGPGATYYFESRNNVWLSGQIGAVTIKDRENWGDQWAIGTEIEAGLYGWTGRKWSMGASVFGGLEGINLDGDDRMPWGWRLGLRLGVVYN
jgi:hypothetical protein